MIEFNLVGKSYGEAGRGSAPRFALRNVSFRLEPGDFVFLTGHSGAGKSTLLRLIMLSEWPTSGELTVNGRLISSFAQKKAGLLNGHRAFVAKHRREIGTVFQDHCLLMDRTIYENVALPLDIAGGLGKREKTRRVKSVLEKVGLAGCERDTPRMLSGGEQQRVGIARALIHKPKILLADEPTGNLDPELSREIMLLFQRFSEVGVTVILATHDIELLNQSDGNQRVLELNDGGLVSERYLGVAHSEAAHLVF